MEIIAKQAKEIQIAIVEGGPTVEGLREIARNPPKVAQKRRTAVVQIATSSIATLLEHGEQVGGEDLARARDLQA